jgi:glyoxylase-like metal-dependent hydrolase (beta-lactamase superfamily II)
LDNTSHLGGQGPDELVPSRYALRVGEIDVLVISDGVLPISAETIAYNADPADLAAWLDDMFLPPEVLEWPLNVAVVRSGDQTILIDAGLGVEFPDFPRAGRLALRLHPPGVPNALRSAASQFLDEYRSQLRPFETEYEVAPGVLVRRTGGHTPGHSMVRLASRGDRLTFVGDAVFQVAFDRPEWFNGFEHDPEEAARVRVSLLRELAATGDALVATHLPFPSVCHVAVAGDAFRCVPAVWDY